MTSLSAQLLIYLASSVYFLICARQLFDDVSGDSFIHFKIAKNLADHGIVSYNVPTPTNASTSPLWTLILGLAFRFSKDAEQRIKSAKFLGFFFHLASAHLAAALVYDLNPTLAAAVYALVIINPNMICWAARGMDSALFLTLVGLSFYLQTISAPSAALGATLGTLYIARPESIFIIASFCMAQALSLPLDSLIAFCIALAVFPCIYHGWLLANFRTLVPSSIARLKHYRQYAKCLFWCFYVNIHDNPLVALTRTYFRPVSFVSALLLFTPHSEGYFLTLSILVLLLFFHSFVLVGSDYGWRYYIGIFYVLIIFMAMQLATLPELVGCAIGITTLVAYGLLSRKEFRKLRRFSEFFVVGQDLPVRKDIAGWLAVNANVGDSVLCKEVDAIAYYTSGIRFISIDGLLNQDVASAMEPTGAYVLDVVQKYRPRFLIIEDYIYKKYPFWMGTWMATLCSSNIKSGDTVQRNCLSLTLVHTSKPYRFYSTMEGHLFDEQYAWLVFEVALPNS